MVLTKKYWNMNFLLSKIDENGEKIALIYQDQFYKYSDFKVQINKYYLEIKNSIKNGEVVSIISGWSYFSISLFFALTKNKNILVPISTDVAGEIKSKIKEGFVNKIIEITEDGKLIITNTLLKKSHPLISKLKKTEQSGLILFSSGTTGVQKSMLHNLDSLIKAHEKKNTKNLKVMLFLNFDHIAGLDTLFRIFSIAGTLVLPTKREPYYICSLIEKYKINVLPVSPTFLNLILLGEVFKSFDLSALKIIGYGAEPMPKILLAKIRSILPNVELQQKYGTSETNAIRIISKSSDSLYFKISDKNIEYKIVEEELWLKSKNNVLGYLNIDERENFEENWFKTGDIVEEATEGYFKIIGRKNEIINVGGMKVFPIEVENALLSIPEIKECLVYGEKNIFTGQSVSADIVLKKIISRAEITTKIIKHCSRSLENFKIPVKINIKSEIELNKRQKKQRTKIK